MADTKSYAESVRDVYVKTARDFYRLSIDADVETTDPAAFLRRARDARIQAFETWPLTNRQEFHLARLDAEAEVRTPEGQRLRDAILAKLAWKIETRQPQAQVARRRLSRSTPAL